MKNFDPVCILLPSGIEGVGVFALRNFTIGELLPFFQSQKNISHWVSAVQLKKMTELQRRWCKRYGVLDDFGYWIPNNPHLMDYGWFMNHSDNPNTRCADDGHSYFVIIPITKGQEITINYNEIGDDNPDHSETDLFWDREQ